jgi:sarcosine reductase
MRLELVSCDVKEVRFASRTHYSDGVLSIDKQELRGLLLEDPTFADVAIDIVHPGDSVRVIHVMDAVEPRCKREPASTFPGFVGPQQTVGEGRTWRLGGMAVVATGQPVAGEPTYWREAIIDMQGPGAVVTPFGSLVNLVLSFVPRREYLDTEHPDAIIRNIMVGSAFAQRYNRSVRVAELKAAAYLAETVTDLPGGRVEVYELSPVYTSLPRVVYFFQLSGLTVYGENADRILPTLMHPNEILDGALVNELSNLHAFCRYSTFDSQNHGIVKELYARHGRDVDFAGAILYPAASDDVKEKERMAEYAVKLARMLGAHGACNSYLGGGHPAVEFMLICKKAEQAGIKTVQVMPESYGTPDDPGFVYFVPEATRIASTGRCTQNVDLPSVETLVGGNELFDRPDRPAGRLDIPYRYLFGCSTSTGYGRLTARQY